MEIKEEFQKLILQAFNVSQDTGHLVEDALQKAITNPISQVQAHALLTMVIDKLKEGAEKRGDAETVKTLTMETQKIIDNAMKIREEILKVESASLDALEKLELKEHKGVKPAAILPTPTFHRREVPVMGGWVKTTDIKLWDKNERLDIHIGQFKATNGREPSSEELLELMLSKMPLPGLTVGEDQFKIVELANSIANNGVRKSPIIDLDGTLLDGNRRVAACYYILNSRDFDLEQKRRAEYIFVWQLTEHATNEDRDAVVVSLNFEPDSKQDWPQYVKARIIYNEWQAMLALEPTAPNATRVSKLKRDLSSKFGYGGDVYMVSRYIKMVDWANEFEGYLVEEKRHDEFHVKHQASKYFEYFDELSKGTNPGGVAYTLNQDDSFKHLVFDLLFQGKFKNWTLIRLLKFYNQDVTEALIKARDLTDVETAQDEVEAKLTDARNQLRESRVGNPNQRIEVFTRWLEQLPISAFRDTISPQNLNKLLGALQLVEKQIQDQQATNS